MRPQVQSRALTAALLAAVLLLSRCGGSSPSAPSPSAQIPTGNQVLRITFLAPCPALTGNPLALLPLVYSRVNVTGGNSDWVATAGTAAAGDVELRLHADGGSPTGALRLTGTIKGVAVHMPELVSTLPPWEGRVSFGSDGRTNVSGFSFGVTPITPTGGVDGIGTGAVTLSNSAGASCSGTSFSWALAGS